MLGNVGVGGALMSVILVVIAWGIPLLIALWFIRTFSAMAESQRDIANRLASIDEHLRRTNSA